jgi:hypothetical protein
VALKTPRYLAVSVRDKVFSKAQISVGQKAEVKHSSPLRIFNQEEV